MDVAGRSDVAVAQPFLDVLEGYTVGIKKGRAGVPLRYNNDKPDESRIIKGFQGFKAVF